MIICILCFYNRFEFDIIIIGCNVRSPAGTLPFASSNTSVVLSWLFLVALAAHGKAFLVIALSPATTVPLALTDRLELPSRALGRALATLARACSVVALAPTLAPVQTTQLTSHRPRRPRWCNLTQLTLLFARSWTICLLFFYPTLAVSVPVAVELVHPSFSWWFLIADAAQSFAFIILITAFLDPTVALRVTPIASKHSLEVAERGRLSIHTSQSSIQDAAFFVLNIALLFSPALATASAVGSGIPSFAIVRCNRMAHSFTLAILLALGPGNCAQAGKKG